MASLRPTLSQLSLSQSNFLRKSTWNNHLPCYIHKRIAKLQTFTSSKSSTFRVRCSSPETNKQNNGKFVLFLIFIPHLVAIVFVIIFVLVRIIVNLKLYIRLLDFWTLFNDSYLWYSLCFLIRLLKLYFFFLTFLLCLQLVYDEFLCFQHVRSCGLSCVD